MMEKQTEKEIKPEPIPVVFEKKAEPVDRKTELMRKRDAGKPKMTEAETKELNEILAAEALAHKRGALTHKLCAQVDTHGRKEIAKVKREVTDRVAKLIQQKNGEVKSVNDMLASSLKDLDRNTKKAMQDLQKAHNKARAELIRVNSEAQKAINEKYAVQLSEAEQEIEDRINEVGEIVSNFQQCIETLEVGQLEDLEKGKAVALTDEKGEKEYLVVPGQPPP